MAGDSSFDVVSKVDRQEVDNALNQAYKEIAQRYDFKGVGASIEFSGEAVLMKTNLPTPAAFASRPSDAVPKTLFLIASPGFCSIKGTCLWAAA